MAEIKTAARVTVVKLALIEEDEQCQPREAQDAAHAEQLRVAYRENAAEVPALHVVELTEAGGGHARGALVLIDGYHRRWALAKDKATTARVEIVSKGTILDARFQALCSNHGHGLNRTHAGKRLVVRRALEHPYAADMSHSDIADHCHVSVDLVRDVRAELDEASASAKARAEAAAKAAAKAKEMPNASPRAVAKAAGVSRNAATTALKAQRGGVALGSETTQGPHTKPVESHDPNAALLASYDAWRRSIVQLLKALGESRASQLNDPLKALRYAIRGGRSARCPACEGTGQPRRNPSGPATAVLDHCYYCAGTSEVAERDLPRLAAMGLE